MIFDEGEAVNHNYESLLNLIAIAKKHGLRTLKTPTYELELWDRPVEAPIVSAEPENKDPVPLMGGDMPSDEQMLYYSTDHYDEIEQELKDAQAPETTP